MRIGGSQPEYSCIFWDEAAEDWSGEGCSVHASPNDAGARKDLLVCACNHLTDFVSIVKALVQVVEQGGFTKARAAGLAACGRWTRKGSAALRCRAPLITPPS